MPKRKEIENKDLEVFIDYYMDGNLRRFLRYHKNQYSFQLIYSNTLKHVKKSNKAMYKKLMALNKPPKHMAFMLNVFITLDKKFDIGFNSKLLKDFLLIEDDLEELVYDYMARIKGYRLEHNKKKLYPKINKKEALKEQKSRGFVHINNFEDYRGDCAHIISLANPSYYYPMNILLYRDHQDNGSGVYMSPYILLPLYGVEGFTRINIPKGITN